VTARPATAPGGVAEPAARCRSVARSDCDDSTDRFDRDESVERLDIDEPSDRNDANDPTDPMPRHEPTEPIDSTEPVLAMLRTEPSDHSDHRDDATPPVSSCDAARVQLTFVPALGFTASHEGLKLRLPRTRDEPSTDL
jgi:hypothetical protein